jgi:hypothetical protein
VTRLQQTETNMREEILQLFCVDRRPTEMPERVTGSRASDMFAVNVLRIVAAILLIWLGYLWRLSDALCGGICYFAVFWIARLW